MNQALEPYEMTVAVQPGDIDQLGHVNNIAYLRWVQDIAVVHWKKFAALADQAELAWVVLRHEIDYKRPAYIEDEVIARTWVGTASGIRFVRFTELLRGGDRSVLAKARTVWCPIDRKTGNPTIVSQHVREHFSNPASLPEDT